MKLPDAAQVREWDAFTIQHEPISSVGLMERAARQCTRWLISRHLHERPVKIICGTGNNGGDGLAIARQLLETGTVPEVFIAGKEDKGSGDFNANLQQLRLMPGSMIRLAGDALPVITPGDVVIDALFGSGLSRPLQGDHAALVQHISDSGATVISIDIPSGMFPDRSSYGNTIVKADHTLSFQCLKLCFMAAENSRYSGNIHVLDIGLHASFIASIDTKYHLTGLSDAQSIYKCRNAFSHKGDFGHALLAGGAAGKAGAAIIAAEACVRSGAGRTSVHLLSGDHAALNTRCPEAMTLAGDELVKKNLSRFNAIGIGPGLGTGDIATHLVSLVSANFEGAVCFDADALNILAQQNALLDHIPPRSILTPHPKEFDRLFGKHTDELARFETALSMSADLDCVIVLKGHHTLVAVDGKGYFNTTGNAGLAKGGSGDALTGIITSLLAQHYDAPAAAKLGVYIHGSAADIALEEQSYESLLASDVNGCIGKAFKMLSMPAN